MLQWISKNKISVLKAVTILGVILVAVFLIPNFTLAQSIANPDSSLKQGLQVIEQPLGLPAFDIRLIIARIIRVALGLVGIVLVGLIIYAGYLWMTAAGNEEQIAQAKATIRNAAIGLAIILSAYSIVSFIISLLGIPPGTTETKTTTEVTDNYNFTGSGALGKVVKDHYPARDQKNIPRNTKIVITFNKPVYLPSFIYDTNKSGKLGDCINIDKDTFNWNKDCDHVTSTIVAGNPPQTKLSDDFINVRRADNGQSIADLVVLASASTVNNVTGIFTIVIKPITDVNSSNGGNLGSDTADVAYTVRLGKGILEDNATNNYPSIFDKQKIGNDFYVWQFTCNNSIDLTPPQVVSIFPQSGKTEPRNSVIQIFFSEPIDPTGLQGQFDVVANQKYFAAPKNSSYQFVYLKNDKQVLPSGNFNLVNNYQTLEFTPSQECGANACGDKIFCLNADNYNLLLQAAKTFPGNFQSKPFSGIADLSGNGLDGNKDNKPQVATTTLPVFDTWKQPDNYYWNFGIEDSIDATSPYLLSISPAINTSYVAKDQPIAMDFSKKLRAESVYYIDLDEYPKNVVAGKPWVPIWHVPAITFDGQSVFLKHGLFLDTEFYMPIVTSSVQDVHFNCFYPGLGPNDGPTNSAENANITASNCDLTKKDATCCAVKSSGEDFCCNGQPASVSAATCFQNVLKTKQIIN